MTTPSPLMSPEAYVHVCGGCCPACRSGQIVGERFDAEAAQVWQRLRCLDCEAVWTAVYALQGYADLERPGAMPQEEQARLLREVLLNRNLHPYDVLDLAAGVEAALLALPAIQERIQAAWNEEQQRAAEETEEPTTNTEIHMAERMCKRCYHKAWAADQQAQREARRATRDTEDAS